jgi:5-methyltetrahydrofolate--homocysteine methyltransferase
MFTVIAERINMTRPRINRAVRDQDAKHIAQQARRQAEAGATHIDVNAGGDPAKEVDDMEWLVRTVSEAVELPLAFDSSNPDAIRAGLNLCNRPSSIINSITGEQERIEGILPLVQEFETGVVCLTMDDTGMPEDLDGRLRLTDALANRLKDAGVSLDRVYFDHLVRPASTNPGQAGLILDAIRHTKREHPESHIALGLSNISYGVPGRGNLNRAFLAMLVAAGADGAIVDPCEEGMMSTLLAARAVMGLDDYCMEYLTAYRKEQSK